MQQPAQKTQGYKLQDSKNLKIKYHGSVYYTLTSLHKGRIQQCRSTIKSILPNNTFTIKFKKRSYQQNWPLSKSILNTESHPNTSITNRKPSYYKGRTEQERNLRWGLNIDENSWSLLHLLAMTLREIHNATANSRQRNKRTRARMPKLGIQDPSLACKIDVNFHEKGQYFQLGNHPTAGPLTIGGERKKDFMVDTTQQRLKI